MGPAWEATITRLLRSLPAFLALDLLVVALVFLSASSFFTSWDGKAVSVRAAKSTEPSTWQVLIAESSGAHREVTWPADAVTGLGLPIDNLGVPPLRIPAERPITRKSSFSLSFLVEQGADDEEATPTVRKISTASGTAVGIAVICGVLLLFGRNMALSGSPVDFTPREGGPLVPSEGDPNQRSPSEPGPNAPQKGRPSRPGPPPSPRRRGQGRR